MSGLRIGLEDVPAKGLEKIPINKKEYEMAQVEEPGKPKIEIGIEETKQVVSFGTALTNAIIKALADGKISLLDLGLLINPFTKLFPAIAGIGSVPNEIEDLSEGELEELKKQVIGELEVNDEQAVLIVEYSLQVIHDIYALYKIAKS